MENYNQQINEAPKNNSSNSMTITVISILCIVFPFLGTLGVHDFATKRIKQGFIHLIMWLSIIPSFFLLMSPFACDSGCDGGKSTMINILFWLGVALLFVVIASYIWAIVECVQILSGNINATRESKKHTL